MHFAVQRGRRYANERKIVLKSKTLRRAAQGKYRVAGRNVNRETQRELAARCIANCNASFAAENAAE